MPVVSFGGNVVGEREKRGSGYELMGESRVLKWSRRGRAVKTPRWRMHASTTQ